jgi:co-chaperonin GroES (HSP10)
MKFVPLNNNVIVKRKDPIKTTSSGIVLQTSLEPDRGIVVATSTNDVEIGNELLLNWNKAYKIDNEHYKIHVSEIIAIFE